MKSYWDILPNDIQIYIIRISKLDVIMNKKKEFITFFKNKLLIPCNFNICYGLHLLELPINNDFNVKYINYYIELIIDHFLNHRIYSMNKLMKLKESTLRLFLYQEVFYNSISFWRYYYFMKKYNQEFTFEFIGQRWLQKFCKIS